MKDQLNGLTNIMNQKMWNSPFKVSYLQNCFMIEMNFADPSRKKAGIKRMKKADLKIDMTPMVDLGFLLISFFIFTTEISKPATTNLYMPKDGPVTPVPESRSLTILLNYNDVFHYSGDMNEAIKNRQIFQSSFSEINGIGSIIRRKQNELAKRMIDKKQLIVLIKPSANSSYKNMIDALDEMLINGVTRYMIVDQEEEEKGYLKQ